MAAGTITLTNNANTLVGTGTTFTVDVHANDFMVVVVGGVQYTLGVDSVASDTSITLIRTYTGPSLNGLAWSAVPAKTMARITAELAEQTTFSIRQSNLDKANWQGFYTATGDTTINLADGSSVTGPSWPAMQAAISDGVKGKAASGSNSDITELKGLTTALTIAQGGTGAKTAAEALTALGALPKTGGALSGALSWSTTALARSTAGNMGLTMSGNNRVLIPYANGSVMIMNVSATGTASAGGVSFTFPQAFGTIFSFVGISGDNAALGGTVSVINISNSGVDLAVRNADGSYKTGAVRINYIAMGITA